MTWEQTVSHPFITSYHQTRQLIVKNREQRKKIEELERKITAMETKIEGDEMNLPEACK
jgi:hypothetical protein